MEYPINNRLSQHESMCSFWLKLARFGSVFANSLPTLFGAGGNRLR